MNNDLISRSYILTQIDLAIREAEGIDKEHLERVRDFINVLPCDEELNRHVYCTACEYLKITEEECKCLYADKCNLNDPEDSMQRRDRPCWTPKEDNLPYAITH